MYETNNFNPNDRFSGEFDMYFSLAEAWRKIIMYHIIFQFSILYVFVILSLLNKTKFAIKLQLCSNNTFEINLKEFYIIYNISDSPIDNI